MTAASHLITDFQRAVAVHASEFEMAMLVAQVIDPDLNPTSLLEQFEALIEPLAASKQTQTETEMIVQFFREAGFGQQALSRATLSHSNLAWVMQNRAGLPIAQAALLIEAARRCDLPASGLNFPGHFLVDIAGTLVDPLQVQVISRQQLQSKQLDEAAVEALLKVATPTAFGLRMLNNLKTQYLNVRNYPEVLDLIDYQMALAEADATLVATLEFERGELWQELGAYRVAAEAFERCAAASPLAELSAKATLRATSLTDRTETLH